MRILKANWGDDAEPNFELVDGPANDRWNGRGYEDLFVEGVKVGRRQYAEGLDPEYAGRLAMHVRDPDTGKPVLRFWEGGRICVYEGWLAGAVWEMKDGEVPVLVSGPGFGEPIESDSAWGAPA